MSAPLLPSSAALQVDTHGSDTASALVGASGGTAVGMHGHTHTGGDVLGLVSPASHASTPRQVGENIVVPARAGSDPAVALAAMAAATVPMEAPQTPSGGAAGVHADGHARVPRPSSDGCGNDGSGVIHDAGPLVQVARAAPTSPGVASTPVTTHSSLQPTALRRVVGHGDKVGTEATSDAAGQRRGEERTSSAAVPTPQSPTSDALGRSRQRVDGASASPTQVPPVAPPTASSTSAVPETTGSGNARGGTHNVQFGTVQPPSPAGHALQSEPRAAPDINTSRKGRPTAPVPASEGADGAAPLHEWLVANVVLLRHIPRAYVVDASRRMSSVLVPRDATLVTAGDTARALYIVKSGVLACRASRKARGGCV